LISKALVALSLGIQTINNQILQRRKKKVTTAKKEQRTSKMKTNLVKTKKKGRMKRVM